MAEADPTVAIVDDDPSVLKALTRLLRVRAIYARSYASAREFLTALKDWTPRCLILDLQMPEMSGLDLLQQLARRGIRIPTIIITAHVDSGTRERCKSFGVVAFLSKPVQDISLLAAINDATRIDGNHSHKSS
jgi:FixJ family two-component response regulator